MTPAAKDAQLDFVRLSAEEPSSLYFERFLRHGFSAWPSQYQDRFPGLCTWPGIAGLKQSLRHLANAPADWPVLLAARSLSLVYLASSCMFRVCRNVLATDLSWTTYEQAIKAEAGLTGNRVTTIPVRNDILYRDWTEDDVASGLADAFVEHQCDGLFLPAVDHLGIHLPVQKIAERIRERTELRFCFVDAAQALCHVSLDDCLEVADFIVAGSHKWMGAYLPTGIGLFGPRRSRGMIERRVRDLNQTACSDDPLLQFTEQLDTGGLDGHSETANLSSIFACAGAVFHQLATQDSVVDTAHHSMNEMLALVPRPSAEWHPCQPHESLRSRIVLFELQTPAVKPTCPHSVRKIWLDSGCIVTGYPDGRARLSLPH